LISRPDRVQVWAAQLAANDFPPVCAMTGRPAETWRKFKFATPPIWVYALLILVCFGGLGFIAYAVTVLVTAQRASGHLPLTRSSSRTVSLALWGPVAALGLFVVCWLLAVIISLSTNDQTGSTIAWVFFWIGLLLMLAGLVGRLLLKPLICPRAKVTEIQPRTLDRLVELRNVHPAFVAAVNSMHQQRAAHYAAPPFGATLPQMPGSN
jgi:hypothetical protein